MRVSEKIEKRNNTLISFEIVPPPRGRSIRDILSIVESLLPFDPAWIDVTAHASQAELLERQDGSYQRKIYRKRPGTIGICGIIQNRYKVDTVAHILCLGFTKEETEDALIELHYLGVENILALRGDYPNFEKVVSKDRSSNRYAMDLVTQIKELSDGKYLNNFENPDRLEFCVGVAGYPEKHQEAPNIKTDIQFLKKKVEAGAQYIVSQMFFDNSKYLSFVEQCRENQIEIPIVPGLKVIRNLNQVKTLPKTFHIDLPDQLSEEIIANPKHAKEIGINHCVKQCEGLLNAGVPVLHFYVMNDAAEVNAVLKKLGI